jgi:hypothetical protein
MIAYQHYRLEGGCYFFTGALAQWRKPLLTENIQGTEPFSVFQKLFEQGERGIWQRRFWEHAIRDDSDYRHHVDYIHYNPVKYGYVTRVVDWPFSSFHRFVRLGMYPSDWAGPGLQDMDSVEME